MSGAGIVRARFVQRVDEFTQPLTVEVLAETDRLTWRLWEPLETLWSDSLVGRVTQKQYRVHPSGVSIPKAHSLFRRGQPSPYILPVRLDMPSGHTETIDGVRWGLVDEIALDPQAMRAKPRMYGEHLSDWAAWMFVLCTDTWRFMTPFNRHVLTRSSRVDSEGFTALSLPLTKARQMHLVAGSCLVPWHESPLSAQMVLRINAHPGGPLWTSPVSFADGVLDPGVTQGRRNSFLRPGGSPAGLGHARARSGGFLCWAHPPWRQPHLPCLP